jgi:hypothetical protein
MKLYAGQVKKPHSFLRTSLSDKGIGLPPIQSQPKVKKSGSQDSVLKQLESEHANDMKIVEEIRRFYKCT